MDRKLTESFFNRSPEKVARDLIGKILYVKKRRGFLKSRIVETEAYFGEEDPASWARFGKRKDNLNMWAKPGTILIKNVHKYLMLNFVTGKEGKPSAVLIRAIEPINFVGRTSGPGLLTKELGIEKEINGINIFGEKIFLVEEKNLKKLEIGKSKRVGVKKDLNVPLRFYLLNNKFVSKNGKRRINKKNNF